MLKSALLVAAVAEEAAAVAEEAASNAVPDDEE